MRACTGLRRLVLTGAQISSDGIKHLAELKHLEELDLASTSVSDTGLESLKGLNRLRSLVLDRTTVTDAGLEHLCSLTGLTRLSLVNSSISDTGLAQLSRMQGLKDLCLVGTDVTPSGIESLRQSLPQCTYRALGTESSNFSTLSTRIFRVLVARGGVLWTTCSCPRNVSDHPACRSPMPRQQNTILQSWLDVLREGRNGNRPDRQRPAMHVDA